MTTGVGELIGRLAGPLFLLVVIVLAWRGIRRRGKSGECVPDGPEDEPYRVFTREHDLELSAEEALATLRTASPDFSKGWLQVNPLLSTRWADRAETLLGEQECRFKQLAPSLHAQFDRTARPVPGSDIIAAVLIDQSGSMKGEPIVFAAVTAALLAQLLQRAGVKSEILGFSTAGWHGGKVFQQWQFSGRPKRPGRLCALRHVIYKSADEAQLDAVSLRTMVHLDLLRENVDGEAIAWARERLLNRNEPHKLLVVISDGAPVDDATLLHNGPSYLYRHLIRVLHEVGNDGIVLGAVGINHRVDEYYPISETVLSAQELPDAAIRLVDTLLARVAQRAGEAT